MFETCFEEEDPTAFKLNWTVTLRGKHNGENLIYLSDLETECFYMLKNPKPPKKMRVNRYVSTSPSTVDTEELLRRRIYVDNIQGLRSQHPTIKEDLLLLRICSCKKQTNNGGSGHGSFGTCS